MLQQRRFGVLRFAGRAFGARDDLGQRLVGGTGLLAHPQHRRLALEALRTRGVVGGLPQRELPLGGVGVLPRRGERPLIFAELQVHLDPALTDRLGLVLCRGVLPLCLVGGLRAPPTRLSGRARPLLGRRLKAGGLCELVADLARCPQRSGGGAFERVHAPRGLLDLALRGLKLGLRGPLQLGGARSASVGVRRSTRRQLSAAQGLRLRRPGRFNLGPRSALIAPGLIEGFSRRDPLDEPAFELPLRRHVRFRGGGVRALRGSFGLLRLVALAPNADSLRRRSVHHDLERAALLYANPALVSATTRRIGQGARSLRRLKPRDHPARDGLARHAAVEVKRSGLHERDHPERATLRDRPVEQRVALGVSFDDDGVEPGTERQRDEALRVRRDLQALRQRPALP